MAESAATVIGPLHRGAVAPEDSEAGSINGGPDSPDLSSPSYRNTDSESDEDTPDGTRDLRTEDEEEEDEAVGELADTLVRAPALHPRGSHPEGMIY